MAKHWSDSGGARRSSRFRGLASRRSRHRVRSSKRSRPPAANQPTRCRVSARASPRRRAQGVDVVTGSPVSSDIAHAYTPARLAMDRDAGVIVLVLAGDGQGAIGRAVVDDDDFATARSRVLIVETGTTEIDVGLDVGTRDDDAQHHAGGMVVTSREEAGCADAPGYWPVDWCPLPARDTVDAGAGSTLDSH